MVIYEDTLKPLHELSKEGKENYNKYLESAADEILYKNQHPLRYLYRKIKEWCLKYALRTVETF